MDTFFPHPIGALRKHLFFSLKKKYGDREAAHITTILLQHYYGWSRAEQILRQAEVADDTAVSFFTTALHRLNNNEPLQYILGVAHFFEMELRVTAAVLIPRPETEELARRIVTMHPTATSLLDIGTGSGCIAISIARHLPQCRVSACDISRDALTIAHENAKQQQVDVSFFHLDILQQQPTGQYDIIVSNPPYIPKSEHAGMDDRVVCYEPHQALFVPDHDPLIFYRRILDISQTALHPNGILYFEIHEEKKELLTEWITSHHHYAFRFHSDLQGKNRIMEIQKKPQ